MVQGPFEDLFEDATGEEWTLSDDAPDSIFDTIKYSKEVQKESSSEIVVQAVGAEERRPIDYAGRLAVINVEEATLFFRVEENIFYLISVAVSEDGNLDGKQVERVLSEMYNNIDLTASELSESVSTSDAIRAIKQSYEFLQRNCDRFLTTSRELRKLVDETPPKKEERFDKADKLETDLHNVLSSVYSFRENIDNSISELGVASDCKIHLQRFEDEVSIATGLRHVIQHQQTLKIRWVAKYQHKEQEYQYKIVVPLWAVDNSEFYYGSCYDASGKKYEDPAEYYYRNVDTRLIDLDELVRKTSNAGKETYEELKQDLKSDLDVDPAKAKRTAIASSTEFFDIEPPDETLYL